MDNGQPLEISRITHFIIIMLYGAIVSAKVVGMQHRRSPLIQGELEIPIEVTIRMDSTTKNNHAIMKYKSLAATCYKEPIESF